MHLRLLTITSLIAGIGLAVSAIAQPAVPTKEMVVTPFEQVKFVPIDPTKPNGNQIAVAEGDPASGPSSMYLQFKKGVNPTHVHSSDYRQWYCRPNFSNHRQGCLRRLERKSAPE